MYVCVCVCVRARVRKRAYVRTCVRVLIGIACMRDFIVYARVRVSISVRVFYHALYENVDSFLYALFAC